jgi:hypothetical protein
MLSQEDATLVGQVITSLPVSELAAEFGMGGLDARVRESSHYTGGEYIRVYDGDDFTLERIRNSEYLVRGVDDSLAKLIDIASRVSGRLIELRIRHRFELYAPPKKLMHYLHFGWPQQSDLTGLE